MAILTAIVSYEIIIRGMSPLDAVDSMGRIPDQVT